MAERVAKKGRKDECAERIVAPTVASTVQLLGSEVQAMANEECAHCSVLITEWSTVAKREGKIFCCPNCANAHAGSQSESTDAAIPMPPRSG